MTQMMKKTALAALMGVLAALPAAADSQDRNVSGFTAVELAGSMDVNVTVGPAFSVRVEADEKYIDNVITELDGSELEIRMKRGQSRYKGTILVTVTMPEMEAVSLAGSGDIKVEGATGDFEVELAGSGDITVLGGAAFGEVEIELAGSGDIIVEGKCSELEIELAGSGDVDAEGLKCREADISIAGSGDVKAHASKLAEVMILGSGDVVLYGNPDKIKSRTMGSGDVVQR